MSDQPLGINMSRRAARKLARTERRAATAAARNSEDASSAARRSIKSTIKIVLLLVLINYIGLPALANVRSNIHKLADIEFGWLALGVGLEAGALLAYAQLTRVALPLKSVKLFRLFRVQLATKSLTNVIPGGSAAGAALGYRLLTTSGVEGPDAGFALAAAGLISAVVLNLVFWLALLISMPFYGFRPLYIIASLFGIIVLFFASGLSIALVRGEAGAQRMLHRLTARFKFVDADRLSAIIRQVASRMREILNDRELAVGLTLWASLNWLLDAASLYVFILAFGITANPIAVLVAFGLANVLAVIPLTPGGLGVIEPTLIGVLAGFKVGGAAAIAVVSYRIAAFWLPIPIGAIAYLTVRNDLRPLKLSHAGLAAYEQPASRYDWAEEFGHRPSGTHGDSPSAPNRPEHYDPSADG